MLLSELRVGSCAEPWEAAPAACTQGAHLSGSSSQFPGFQVRLVCCIFVPGFWTIALFSAHWLMCGLQQFSGIYDSLGRAGESGGRQSLIPSNAFDRVHYCYQKIK